MALDKCDRGEIPLPERVWREMALLGVCAATSGAARYLSKTGAGVLALLEMVDLL